MYLSLRRFSKHLAVSVDNQVFLSFLSPHQVFPLETCGAIAHRKGALLRVEHKDVWIAVSILRVYQSIRDVMIIHKLVSFFKAVVIEFSF